MSAIQAWDRGGGNYLKSDENQTQPLMWSFSFNEVMISPDSSTCHEHYEPMNSRYQLGDLNTELYKTPSELGHATIRLYSDMRPIYTHVPTVYSEMTEFTRGYQKLRG